MVKQSTVNYLSSDMLRTGETQKGTDAFVKIQLRVLKGCRFLLTSRELNGESPETRINFFWAGLNGLDWRFTKTEVPGMLEQKNDRELNNVFLFVASLID